MINNPERRDLGQGKLRISEMSEQSRILFGKSQVSKGQKKHHAVAAEAIILEELRTMEGGPS